MSTQLPNKIKLCLIKYEHIKENYRKEKLNLLRTRQSFVNTDLIYADLFSANVKQSHINYFHLPKLLPLYIDPCSHQLKNLKGSVLAFSWQFKESLLPSVLKTLAKNLCLDQFSLSHLISLLYKPH